MALSIGLHWIVLQSVAWAGMFVDYSADYSLVEAIDKTFDAHNKCGLCRFVEEGTQSDAESERLSKTVKLDVINASSIVGAFATPTLEVALEQSFGAPTRTTGPPSPPPLAS